MKWPCLRLLTDYPKYDNEAAILPQLRDDFLQKKY